MAQHDPVMVAWIIFSAAAVANFAVSYQMKVDVRRVVPKDQFPKAIGMRDLRPEIWLLRKHREIYPGDILPLLYLFLTGVWILASVFLFLHNLSARHHLRQ